MEDCLLHNDENNVSYVRTTVCYAIIVRDGLNGQWSMHDDAGDDLLIRAYGHCNLSWWSS